MSVKDIERRSFQIETREDGDGTTIRGYAAVFDQVENGEVIRKGAFKKTLREAKDIKAYWSHDAAGSRVLARTSNKTLQLGEDDKGLWVRMTPNADTTWGKDALASVARGDVDQMSFGFSPVTAAYKTIDGDNVREIKEVKLYEVSLVSEPWYTGTSAAVREMLSQSSNGSEEGPEPGNSHSTPMRSMAEKEIELYEFNKKRKES